MKNPKFFTIEEAEKLIGLLETTFERIKRNKRQYLWLQEEIAVLKFIAECGADETNLDVIELNEKTVKYKAVARNIDKDVAMVETGGCILRDVDKGLVDFFSIQKGTVVFLCWKKGEDSIKYWHSIHDGETGRKSLDRFPSNKE